MAQESETRAALATSVQRLLADTASNMKRIGSLIACRSPPSTRLTVPAFVNDDTCMRYGTPLLKAKDFERALAWFNLSDAPWPIYNRGLCLAGMENFAAAEQEFQKLLEMELPPGHKKLRTNANR